MWLVCGLCVACVCLLCGFCVAFVWLVLRDFLDSVNEVGEDAFVVICFVEIKQAFFSEYCPIIHLPKKSGPHEFDEAALSKICFLKCLGGSDEDSSQVLPADAVQEV